MMSESSCFAMLSAETSRPTMDIRFLVGAALHLVIDRGCGRGKARNEAD